MVQVQVHLYNTIIMEYILYKCIYMVHSTELWQNSYKIKLNNVFVRVINRKKVVGLQIIKFYFFTGYGTKLFGNYLSHWTVPFIEL